MILPLLVMLAITVLATIWARKLARQRARHVNGWALATATIPPVVLILWALPPRVSPAKA